jgi:hypothetical protein
MAGKTLPWQVKFLNPLYFAGSRAVSKECAHWEARNRARGNGNWISRDEIRPKTV